MIWGILSTLMESLGDVFWKKNLEYPHHLSPYGFNILGFWIFFIVSVVLFFGTGTFSRLGEIDYITYICIFGVSILRFCTTILEQKAYTEEKISVLAPYENLNKAFSIIFAFFLFSEASLLSFLIALSIVFLISITNISKKHIELPRFFWSFFLYQVLISLSTIVVGYILLRLHYSDYFILDTVISMVLLTSIVCYNREQKQLFALPLDFYKTRFFAAGLFVISSLIGLYIIDEFGIIIAIILSFLSLVFTLLFSYIFLKDIPTQKNLVFTIGTTILISIGFYFK